MRTIEDFVTEQICKGRTKEQVRSIAISTWWSSEVQKVLDVYDSLSSLVK